MAGKAKGDRSSKVKALMSNEIFLDELNKIKKGVNEDKYNIEIIKLRNSWGLTWDYHETLTHYLETGEIDFSLGDSDIRVIDYKAREVYPSHSPKDEFRVMDALKGHGSNGAYIKLPKELTKTVLVNFVKDHYEDIIKPILDKNYPNRLTNQFPEQQSNRKTTIFRMHEEGFPMVEICEANNCEPKYVRDVIKEYKDKVSS